MQTGQSSCGSHNKRCHHTTDQLKAAQTLCVSAMEDVFEQTYISLPEPSLCQPVSSDPHRICPSCPAAWPAPPSSSSPGPHCPDLDPFHLESGLSWAGFLRKREALSETTTKLEHLRPFTTGMVEPTSHVLTWRITDSALNCLFIGFNDNLTIYVHADVVDKWKQIFCLLVGVIGADVQPLDPVCHRPHLRTQQCICEAAGTLLKTLLSHGGHRPTMLSYQWPHAFLSSLTNIITDKLHLRKVDYNWLHISPQRALCFQSSCWIQLEFWFGNLLPKSVFFHLKGIFLCSYMLPPLYRHHTYFMFSCSNFDTRDDSRYLQLQPKPLSFLHGTTSYAPKKLAFWINVGVWWKQAKNPKLFLWWKSLQTNYSI